MVVCSGSVSVQCAVFAVWSVAQVDVQYGSGECQSSYHRDGVKVCPSLSNIRVLPVCVCESIKIHSEMDVAPWIGMGYPCVSMGTCRYNHQFQQKRLCRYI